MVYIPSLTRHVLYGEPDMGTSLRTTPVLFLNIKPRKSVKRKQKATKK